MAFFNFGTPSISQERLKLTSNLACGLTTKGTNEQNSKLSQGVVKRSRDLLLKFWDPSISLKWLKLETSNLACILSTKDPNDKNAKLGQRGS